MEEHKRQGIEIYVRGDVDFPHLEPEDNEAPDNNSNDTLLSDIPVEDQVIIGNDVELPNPMFF